MTARQGPEGAARALRARPEPGGPGAARPRRGSVPAGGPAPGHRPGADRPSGLDLAARSLPGRLLRWAPARLLVTVPTVALLVLVLLAAFLGPADPQRNLATTLTWNVWFCLVFVLVLVTGRGWCLVCPFGALAEALQRRTAWGPGRPIGLRRVLPEGLTRFGYLVPVAALVALTRVEERFAVAEGAAPVRTGYLLATVLVVTSAGFLVLERRSYCRYLCPLSALIGILGAVAPVAGFRSRDRAACAACRTRECLRGAPAAGAATGAGAGRRDGGCPWYAWPGSEDSNLSCGLCGECVTACPTDHVGVYLTAPLDGVVRPRRRADVGWGVAVLLGLAVQEQVHRTSPYLAVRAWLERTVPLPEFAGTAVFLATIGGVVLLLAGTVRLVVEASARTAPDGAPAAWSFVYGRNRFRAVFLPVAYACLPLVAADYLACQLPAFLTGAAAVPPALVHPFGPGPAAGGQPGALLGPTAIVTVQAVVVGAGILASLLAGLRITAGRAASSGPGLRIGTAAAVVAVGTVLLLLVLAPVLTAQPASGSTVQWLT